MVAGRDGIDTPNGPRTRPNQSGGASSAGADPRIPPDATANGESVDPAPHEAFARIAHDVAELRSHAAYYFAARFDRLLIGARLFLWRTIFISIALIMAGATIVVASVLMLIGIAQAIGEFVGRPWAGNIIVGLFLLLAVAGATHYILGKLVLANRAQLIRKYEHRKQEQRDSVGRAVGDK